MPGRTRLGSMAAAITLNSQQWLRSAGAVQRSNNQMNASALRVRRSVERFQRGFSTAARGVRNSALIITGAAAGVAVASRRVADSTAALRELSTAIELGVEPIQALQFAYESAGKEAETASRGLTRFTSELAKLQSGVTTTATTTLRQIDEDLVRIFQNAPSTEAALRELLNLMRDAPASVQRSLADAFFGTRGGAAFLQTAREFNFSMEEMLRNLSRVGFLSTEQVDAGKELSQAFLDVSKSFRTAFAQLVLDNAAELEAILQRLTRNIREFVAGGGLDRIRQAVIDMAEGFQTLGRNIESLAELLVRLTAAVVGVILLAAPLGRFFGVLGSLGASLRLAGNQLRELLQGYATLLARTTSSLINSIAQFVSGALAAAIGFVFGPELFAELRDLFQSFFDEVDEGVAREIDRADLSDTTRALDKKFGEAYRRAISSFTSTASQDFAAAFQRDLARAARGEFGVSEGRQQRDVASAQARDAQKSADAEQRASLLRLSETASALRLFELNRAIAKSEEERLRVLQQIEDVTGSLEFGMNSFADAIVRGTKASEALASAVNSVVAELFKVLVFRPAVEAIGAGISGFFQGAFLGSGRPQVNQTQGGTVARQFGGPVAAGRTYLVGESGPELFRPYDSGRVIPNLAGAAAAPVNIEIVNNGTPQRVQSTQQQFDGRAMVTRIVTDDIRQGGDISRSLQGRYQLARRPT